MSTSYRQIRPSWYTELTPRDDVTLVTSTPAVAATAPPTPGSSAIYQQVIASLKNKVDMLLNIYSENPIPVPTKVTHHPQGYHDYYYP